MKTVTYQEPTEGGIYIEGEFLCTKSEAAEMAAEIYFLGVGDLVKSSNNSEGITHFNMDAKLFQIYKKMWAGGRMWG